MEHQKTINLQLLKKHNFLQ